MIYALLRYLFIEVPAAFLKGLGFVIFDKDEIIGTTFICRRIRKPIDKNAILAEYLERCRKLVQEEDKDKNEKK